MHKTLTQNLSSFRKHHPALYSTLALKKMTTANKPSQDVPIHPSQHDLLQNALQEQCDFIYLLGLDDATFLPKFISLWIRENRGAMILEPNREVFLQAMGTIDLRTCIESQKVFWALGDNIQEQINTIFKDSLCYAAATPRFIENGNQRKDFNNLLTWLQNQVRIDKRNLIQRLNNLSKTLANKPPSMQHPRLWTYEDLRNKARHSVIEHVLMRTLMFHLRKLGYQTEYTCLLPGRYYPPYYRILKMALFEPDLIFLCNEGPAYESALGSELSRSLPIPKVIWFADDPIYGEHLIKRHQITQDEIYLVADYEWKDPLLENGAQGASYMPGGATKTRRGKKRGSRKCDVVFVGQVREQSTFFKPLSEAWKHYCRQVISEKLRFPRMKVRDVMQHFPMPEALPDDRLDELRQKVLWEANTRFRLRILQQIAHYDVHLYGNEDWLKLLPKEIAQKCFRGVLPFKRLFEVYRNARIVLNIHSLQSYTCMNVRDFDVPAAGGFLLSDWLPKADEIYKPGFLEHLPLETTANQEVFFYRSPDELIALIDYFLAHEKQRRQCIERARKKVLAHHTYAHRAQWLDSLFRTVLANGVD